MPAMGPFPDIGGVEIERESVRRYIAVVALGGFLAIIFLIVVVCLLGQCSHPARPAIDDAVKLLTATSSVLSGVVGAVVGFYFNSK